MDVHLILDPHLPAQELLRLGRLAEEQGFAAVWTSSLLGARDPFVNMAALAGGTARIRMGPIAVNPFDTHPAKIAASLLTLNEISGGRAQIVIGGGGEALAGLGIRPERRVRAVRECVAILRNAARAERFDFDGEAFRVAAFGCRWAHATAPRIYVGANGPQMLAMAARVADGIMTSDLPAPLLARAITDARGARASAGADAPPLRFSNFTAWHVYRDPAKARAEAVRWLAFRGMFRRWVCTSFMDEADYGLIESKRAEFYRAATGGPPVEGVPARLLDALVEHLTITGSVKELDRHLGHLRALERAGASEVALRLYDDPESSIRLIGERIVPALMRDHGREQ